ncbi:ATP-binding protein [Planosporangium sp. 12N6]|uniref:ATP-binding protein n=1 Tax=Planosporangium spinosum TaxID=3402278 RepID=UPI003CF48D1C
MTSPDVPVSDQEHRPLVEAPAVVGVDQPFDADGLYALRATLAAHAVRLGLTEETAEHLLIVASELATNAIRHGGGAGRLRLWRTASTLYCQVSDHGPGIADPNAGGTPPARPDNGGHGLWICRRLCDDLTIAGAGGDDHGAIVTAVLRLTDRPAPPGDGD